MKNKASGFLKKIITVVTAMAKAKSLALKTKTRDIRTRLIIFSLLRNKKILMSSVSEKLRALMGQQDHHHYHHSKKKDEDEDDEVEEESKAIVVHDNDAVYSSVHESLPNPTHTEVADDFENQEEECGENDENKYPDLTHTLSDDMELENGGRGGSVIDLVKKSKPQGEEFRLEDEIDHLADLFIQRFHRQILMQKQLSFKRYQDMLDRSA
ncbi:hypothetical protein KPL70_003166 [Citrus sinensis]|uniref:uncharacterized protein LOC102612020 n=1 Tax=Citrus sinensis TaxID=2711 RepID=UPI00219CFEE9|nr:uncharacterized protein LOC102612020 [Citrus sinensis]KAH9743029.1 hypothetical protein KPL70_003166 [Citrus sinensis]